MFLWDFVPFNFVEHMRSGTDSGREGLTRNLCSSLSSSGASGAEVSQIPPHFPHQTKSWALPCALGHSHVGKRLKCSPPPSVATKPEAFKCPKCFGEVLRLLVTGDQGL